MPESAADLPREPDALPPSMGMLWICRGDALPQPGQAQGSLRSARRRSTEKSPQSEHR